MIIAVARKLAIALWRFLEQGLSTHPEAEPTPFDRLEDYPDEAAS